MHSHSSCYHTGYSLTCAEYDELRRIADESCMLCGAKPGGVEIEHDHALGQWAVRGLVCRYCNQYLRAVEDGRRPSSPMTDAYFANAWHKRAVSSHAKAARARPKVDCPTCGYHVALHGNGRLQRHWSRLPGQAEICAGRS